MVRGDLAAITKAILAAQGNDLDPTEEDYASAYVGASLLADLILDVRAIRKLLTPSQ